MNSELARYCPGCDTEQAYYRVASTTLHLGTKTKWRCPNCEFGVVRIDGDVDSASAIDSAAP